MYWLRRILGQQVIEELVACAAAPLPGIALVPFLGVVEFRIDVAEVARNSKILWRTTWPMLNFAGFYRVHLRYLAQKPRHSILRLDDCPRRRAMAGA